MRAMIFRQQGKPLSYEDAPTPTPGPDQVLLHVQVCGVCRTDLHIIDGELTEPKLPLIPGHQIVGIVAALGERVTRFAEGDRVGVPWVGSTCNHCRYCLSGRENLCDDARFTGYHIDGGFAEYAVADHRFCFPIPPGYPDLQAAPLALRWADRISLARDGRRCGKPWPIRFWRCCSYRSSGRSLARTKSLCLHQNGRYRRPGVRARDGRRLGRWFL